MSFLVHGLVPLNSEKLCVNNSFVYIGVVNETTLVDKATVCNI